VDHDGARAWVSDGSVILFLFLFLLIFLRNASADERKIKRKRKISRPSRNLFHTNPVFTFRSMLSLLNDRCPLLAAAAAGR
jgi:hypothetical protein